MTVPKVLISILNWNAPESTSKTVNSVLHSKYIDYEILVIDNCSADDSLNILRSTFPDLKVIKTSENLGYAGAHKISSIYAIGHEFDLLWILNNDVIVNEYTLQELVTAYLQNGDAIYGSICLDKTGKFIEFGGGHEFVGDKVNYNTKYNSFYGIQINSLKLPFAEVSDVQGSSFLVPLNVISKYGFMKTSYFLYGEETAYSYFLRNKFFIKTFIVFNSHIIHFNSTSFTISPKLQWVKNYYTIRNSNLVQAEYMKELPVFDMNFTRIFDYGIFFLKHIFSKKSNRSNEYMAEYFSMLGRFHSYLRIRGKYLDPEKYMILLLVIFCVV